jgi:hypothetical protein
MPLFQSEEEVYEHLGKVLSDAVADPELQPRLRRAQTIVQYRLSDPRAHITVRLKPGEDVQVDYGPTALQPEVILSMPVDTAHRLWLGRLGVTVALARNEVRPRGSSADVLRALPVAALLAERYEAHLREADRGDLVSVA